MRTRVAEKGQTPARNGIKEETANARTDAHPDSPDSAQQLAGVMLPDGFVIPDGFSGSFNPGDRFGTVQEAQFLDSHGVTELAAFCAQFATHQ